jgi:hypothetical protein
MTIDEYKKLYPHENPGFSSCRFMIDHGMLLFDESAGSWGGPYEGGFAYYAIRNHKLENYKIRSEQDIRLWFRFHGLKAKSEEHLQKKLKTLTKKELIEWQRRQDYYRIDVPTIEKPYSLYICGNDDTSYSKFYSYQGEAIEEVQYFLIDQPLNIKVHIYGNGFVFTN